MALRGKVKKVQNSCDDYEDAFEVDEGGNARRANWNAELHKVFIKLCIDEKKKGNMPATYFNSQGWENIAKCFIQETGRAYTGSQLQNHLDKMRNEWQAWVFVKQRATGINWDSEKKTPMASNEWWKKLAKVDKLVLKFKKKGLQHEDDYFDLFSGVIATGEYAWAPSQGLLPGKSTVYLRDQMSDDNDISSEEDTSETEDEDYEENCSSEDDFAMDEMTPLTNVKWQNQSDEGQSCGSKKRRLTSTDRINAAFDRMITQMDRLHDAKLSLIKGISVKEVLTILNQLPGVTKGSPLYFSACRLFAKPYNREIFIALEDNDLQLIWLKDMLLREQYVDPPQQFVPFSGGFSQQSGQFAQPTPSFIPSQVPAHSDASSAHSAPDP